MSFAYNNRKAANRTRNKRRINPSLLLALVLAVNQAAGDDIELFVSTNDQPIQCAAPNVIFLIDNSGSMATEVMTQEDWDASQTYAGCFDTSKYYYSATGSQPECESSSHFGKAANACDAIRNTEYTGEFQAWDSANERWVKLTDAGVEPDIVECAADEGLHGDGISDETYAVDGPAGPWSNAESDRIAWGSSASVVTIYDGNWLNWNQNPPTIVKSRLEIVKDATKATLDNLTNVNVAFANFNSNDGASIRHAIEPIDVARESIKTLIDGLQPDNVSWLSESLYEIGQYLRGAEIEFGKAPTGESVASSRRGGSLASGTYLSPLTSTGQNTYIVALTDGDPSDDISANRLIESLPDYAQLVGEPCDDNIDGACAPAMAEYLLKSDLRSDVAGQQAAITHTIGFRADDALTASIAERGGGRYFLVDNTASLTSALADLTRDLARTASLLAPPKIPLNIFNQAERLDDVYVSMFQPAPTQHWPGNLKRYRLQKTADGTILVDANGNNVIDPGTGFFKDSAVSFWSAPLADGSDATLGGAASQLPDSSARKLYSNVVGNGLQEVTVDNTSITAEMVGAPEDERESTIQWARGLDSRDADEDGITAEDRKAMGDPLHVQPITVTYGADAGNSNTVVFIATNDGYLHAVNAVDGVEIWSFIPRRLLRRLYELSLEDPSINKEYGLDGEIRFIEVGDRKILVVGMRRGGEALFAMDVTSRTAPRLIWTIDSNDPGFLDLGQTWSAATAARVAIGGSIRDVILFGGGYDAGQDNGAFRTDVKGNAIYMVDTLTGNLEWSAGNPNSRSDHDLELARMKFSIPARLRVLDNDRDGLTDRIYVGDMGAQIWRIDIVNGQGRSTLAEGGVLASLGGADDGTPARADARRFYTTPDVVDVILDEKLFTAINIGSGYRAHPLDSLTGEEFYSIRDFHSLEVVPTESYGSASLPIVTRADLIDVTDNVTPTLEPTDAGWLLRLESPGEKILSSSLTISNVLFFNSFIPSAANNSCLPGGGQNRFYRISVLGGSPLTNLDKSLDTEQFTKEDRYVNVGQVQDVPLEVMPGPDGICSGLDCFDGENEFGDAGDDGGDGGGARDGLGDVNETYWYPVTKP